MTEIPEADAWEQATDLLPDEEGPDGQGTADPTPSYLGDDVPEADAVEQSIPIRTDEDEYR